METVEKAVHHRREENGNRRDESDSTEERVKPRKYVEMR
jgi:hypothetical protein